MKYKQSIIASLSVHVLLYVWFSIACAQFNPVYWEERIRWACVVCCAGITACMFFIERIESVWDDGVER